MRIRMLGPLEVQGDHSGPIALGPPKQRTVFGLLATHAGQVVTVEQLVDELWGEKPPRSAVANARMYAATLRRLLSSRASEAVRMDRGGHGYLLSVDAAEVDVSAFRSWAAAGRDAAARGDRLAVLDHLAAAMALWRGDPLPDIVQGDVLAARCLALREEHAAVVEAHAQAHLALGLGPGIVPALRAHLQAHPFRERGWELLIWALYDAGDVGGALAAFTQARSTMVGHLGIEPGRRLIELQQAVLDGVPVGVDAPGPRRHPVAGLSGAYRRPS